MNLFVNLDFEYEYLLGRRSTHRAVTRQNRRWSHIMRLMQGWESAEPRAEPHAGQWLCWGVTPSFEALSPENLYPSSSVVERVNSKVFSAELESSLGVAPPGQIVVAELDELVAHCARGAGHWLVKNPWGVAGRERRRVDPVLDESDLVWARGQFERVDALVAEPLFERERDWSLQFEIEEDGEVAWLGASELLTDSVGHHRGHRVGFRAAPKKAVELATQAARRVSDEGYFGPLGIDAFEGALGGQPRLRAICEINARLTFGRLAFELTRHVDDDRFVWWHPPRSAEINHQKLDVRPLPEFADPGRESASWIVVGHEEPWLI